MSKTKDIFVGTIIEFSILKAKGDLKNDIPKKDIEKFVNSNKDKVNYYYKNYLEKGLNVYDIPIVISSDNHLEFQLLEGA